MSKKKKLSFAPAVLKRSGVSTQFLTDNHISRTSRGIEIPYFTHTGKPVQRECDGGRQFTRTRLHTPISDGRRYTQPEGSKPYGYVAPAFAKVATDAGQSLLVIVEGEFKALALLEAGVPAVGVSGITCAFQEGQLVPGLREVMQAGNWERILFLGDGDTSLIFDFSREAVKLAKEVLPVPLALPRIGLDGPGKGIDDVREKIGPEAFLEYWSKLVSEAEPVDPKESPEALAARLFCRESVEKLKELLK